MELKAKNRALLGKKVKTLRKQGIIPASVFSKKISENNKEALTVQIDDKEFTKVFEQAGATQLVTISLDNGNKLKVLISQVQKHPVSLKPIHVGFYQVDLTEKIRAAVPVILTGAEENELVKNGEALIIQVLKEINVECLPQNIPQKFEVSVDSLKQIGDSITITHAIKVDPDIIEILDIEVATTNEAAIDPIIATMDYQTQLEEIAEEKAVEEVEVIGEKEKIEEGEEPPEEPKEKEK